MTFRFIADHEGEWPVAWMCEDLGGVGQRLLRLGRPARQPRRAEAAGFGGGDRGGPRRGQGPLRQPADDRRVERPRPRLLGEHRGEAHAGPRDSARKSPRRLVRTTDSNHRLPVAANLLDRDFNPVGPNEAWGADITDIPTGEGWLYLAVVEDLFSRMIVGWSMAESMESRLVVDALEMAIARRRPETGLLAHSDRGSQYASDHYQRVLRAEGITCSMSGVGQCWDNAPVESFFGRLKCEVDSDEPFANRSQARAEIFEYLEVFDNRVRRHSSLGHVSPAEFERTHNQSHR